MVRAFVVFFLALALPAGAGVDVVPLTDQTVIADTPNDSADFISLSSAKVAPRGSDFVVAWSASHSRYSGSELVGWSAGISARQIAADGQPAGGGLTLVPQADQVDISEIALASDLSGGYAVIWSSFPERRLASVRLRRFSPSGAPVATAHLDQFASTAGVTSPTLASGALGRLFAIWGRPQPSAPARPGLFGQLLFPSGPALPRFQITARAQGQGKTALGTDGRGNAVLVYENHRRENTSELFLCTYDPNGRPQSGEVRLGAPFQQQRNPALAVHPDGRFVVVWQESRDLRIWARLFDPPYRPLGPPFPVSAENRPEIYYRDFPAVAMDRQGRFVVAWRELSDGAPHVDARAFDPQGTPASEVFRVDQRREDFVFNPGMGPAVAAGDNGTFLIVWTGPEIEAGDKVYARLYAVRERGSGS